VNQQRMMEFFIDNLVLHPAMPAPAPAPASAR
jgi:hypothetical protein